MTIALLLLLWSLLWYCRPLRPRISLLAASRVPRRRRPAGGIIVAVVVTVPVIAGIPGLDKVDLVLLLCARAVGAAPVAPRVVVVIPLPERLDHLDALHLGRVSAREPDERVYSRVVGQFSLADLGAAAGPF